MENKINLLIENIEKVIVGKKSVIVEVIAAMLSGGHVLIEDVPGVGKTKLVAALAKSVDGKFNRIQLTPDIMPSDIIGFSMLNSETHIFEYREGAVMHQIILADEINRTSPKTQSSLLEAMEEGQTTVGGKKYKLPEPFMVIATQNPSEFIGTYKLPEAQTDRFMMKLTVGYPDESEEMRMAENMLNGKTTENIESIMTAEDVIEMKKKVSAVKIKEEVIRYARNIADMTRNESRFVMGISPRAVISLIKASQAKAFLSGRDYVKPDDIKKVAPYVLSHRLTLTSEAKIAKENKEDIINKLINKTKVPI